MKECPSWKTDSCADTEEDSKSYGNQRLITVLTRVLHWSLSWNRPMQSTPPNPISPRSILILSTHLRFGFPSVLCPSGFRTNNITSKLIVYAFLFSHSWYMSCLSHSPWRDQSRYAWWRVLVQAMKLRIMQFSPTSCHLNPLWSKHSLQRPVLKHFQSVFLP
jgi:hypothetical protein